MAVISANRYFLFFLGCVHTFLSSGVIHGWTALRTIFIDEGVYSYKCINDPVYIYTDANWIPDQRQACVKEMTHLNLIYTLGGVGNLCSNLMLGFLMDVKSPRIDGFVSLSIFAVGCFLIAFYKYLFPVDAVMLGFFLIGFSGPAAQLPNFLTCKYFPSIQSTLMNVSAALFDASSIVFVFFEILYILWPSIFSLTTLFVIYGIVIIIMAISAFVFWPEYSEKQLKAMANEDENTEASKAISATVVYPNLSIKQIVLSLEFIYGLVFLSIHVLRLNWIIGTFSDQLNDRLRNEGAVAFLQKFIEFSLPFGFVVIPLIGYLLDKKGFSFSFIVINIFNILWGILWLINNKIVIIFSILFFAASRQMIYGSSFAYLAVMFGYDNFGVTVGILNVIVGIVSITQLLLVYITVNWLDSHWFYANILLVFSPLPLFFYPLLEKYRNYKTGHISNISKEIDHHSNDEETYLLAEKS